jgi:hypothetical protein
MYYLQQGRAEVIAMGTVDASSKHGEYESTSGTGFESRSKGLVSSSKAVQHFCKSLSQGMLG